MLRRAIASIFAFLAILACSWALLSPKFFRVHDFVHAARIAELVEAAKDGHFPVRWSRNFDYGYGMPLFEFYAPLPYYVGGFFYWLGVDVVSSIKILYVISAVLSWIGMYLAVSKAAGRVGGVAAATLYTVSPYRAVNLFVRGALSEAWGMAFLPWVILGTWMVWHRQKWGWAVLSLSVCALALSHNLSLLMFMPLLILWVFCLGAIQLLLGSANKFSAMMKNGFFVAGAVMLGGLLASFYLIPALLEKSYTKVDQILTGYFLYTQHFLYIRQLIIPFWGYGGSGWGPDDGISFFLGFGQWIGLIIVAILLIRFGFLLLRNTGISIWKPGQKQILLMIISSLMLMGISLFMTLNKSQFLWDKIQFLQTIQFPWRWLGPAHFWLAFAVGLSIGLVRPKLFRLALGWVLVLVFLLTQFWYFHPESYMDDADGLYFTDPARIQTQMSSILPDYQPKQMAEKLTPPTSVFLVPQGTEQQVEVLVDRTHQKLFRTHFLSEVKMDILIADFPGWQIEINGQPVPKAEGQNGTMAVQVPGGEQLVGVYFGETPVRQTADWISAAAILLFLLLLFWTSENHFASQKVSYV